MFLQLEDDQYQTEGAWEAVIYLVAYQKNFSLQPLFLEKDVAESLEPRKVTRSL